MRVAWSSRSRWALALGVAAPPALALLAPDVLALRGPKSSVAATTTDQVQAAFPAATAQLSEAEERAAAHARTLESAPAPASPFEHEPAHIEPAPPPEPMPIAAPAPAPTTPKFTLSAVSGGRDRNLALINGTLQRPGDALGDGWKVHSIDAAARTVELRHDDGRTLTLRVNDGARL